MSDVLTIVLVGVVFSAAAAIHGLCGFGFSLISVGILSMLLGPKLAIPLDLIAASANCFYLAWLLRRSIMVKETVTLIILTIVFVPAGTMFLRNFDRMILVRSIGVVILMTSLISLFKLKHSKLFASKMFKFFAGAVSGLFGGAFNMPGPPLVLYAYNCAWPIRNAMANLQLIFSAMTFATVLSFYLAGLLNAKIVCFGFAYMPFIVLFTFIGSRISKKLSVRSLTIVINVFLVCLGVILLVKG